MNDNGSSWTSKDTLNMARITAAWTSVGTTSKAILMGGINMNLVHKMLVQLNGMMELHGLTIKLI